MLGKITAITPVVGEPVVLRFVCRHCKEPIYEAQKDPVKKLYPLQCPVCYFKKFHIDEKGHESRDMQEILVQTGQDDLGHEQDNCGLVFGNEGDFPDWLWEPKVPQNLDKTHRIRGNVAPFFKIGTASHWQRHRTTEVHTDSFQRNLIQAWSDMRVFTSQLQTPPAIINRALHIYRLAARQGVHRGMSILQSIIASLFIGYRTSRIYIPLTELPTSGACPLATVGDECLSL